jgi:hypothetical protein
LYVKGKLAKKGDTEPIIVVRMCRGDSSPARLVSVLIARKMPKLDNSFPADFSSFIMLYIFIEMICLA